MLFRDDEPRPARSTSVLGRFSGIFAAEDVAASRVQRELSDLAGQASGEAERLRAAIAAAREAQTDAERELHELHEECAGIERLIQESVLVARPAGPRPGGGGPQPKPKAKPKTRTKQQRPTKPAKPAAASAAPSPAPSKRKDFHARRRRQRSRVAAAAVILGAIVAGVTLISLVIESSGSASSYEMIADVLAALNKNVYRAMVDTMATPLLGLDDYARLLEARQFGAGFVGDASTADPVVVASVAALDVAWLYFGTATEGNFFGACLHEDSGEPLIVYSSNGTTGMSLVRLGVDAAGYRDWAAVVDESPGYDPRVRPWYTAAQAANATTVMSVPYKDFASGGWMVTASRSVDEVGAVAAADFFLSDLSSTARDVIQAAFGDGDGDEATIFVILDDWDIIAASVEGFFDGADDLPNALTQAPESRIGKAARLLKGEFGSPDLFDAHWAYVEGDDVFVDVLGFEEPVTGLRLWTVCVAPQSTWFAFVESGAVGTAVAVLALVATSLVLVAVSKQQAKLKKKPAYQRSAGLKDPELNWNVVFVVLETMLIFATAYTLWTASASEDIDALVDQRLEAARSQISAELLGFMAAPVSANALQQAALDAGVVFIAGMANLTAAQQDANDAFWLSKARAFAALDLVYVGTESGEYMGAGPHGPAGEIVVSASTTETNGYYEYLPDSSGLRRNASAVTSYNEGYDPRVRPWYVEATTTPSWSSIYVFASDGGGLGITATVGFSGDEADGVWATDYALSDLNEFVAGLDLGSDAASVVFVVERQYVEYDAGANAVDGALVCASGGSLAAADGGRRFARDSEDAVVARVDFELRKRFGAYADMPAQWSGHVAKGTDVGEQIVVVQAVADAHGLDWVLVVAFEYDDFYADIVRRGEQAVLVALGILVLLVWIVVVFSSEQKKADEARRRCAPDPDAMGHLTEDTRAELHSLMAFLGADDKMHLATFLLLLPSSVVRRTFLSGLRRLFSEELEAFVRVLRELPLDDRRAFVASVALLDAPDVQQFVRGLPGVCSEVSEVFYDQQLRELRVLVQYALHFNELPAADADALQQLSLRLAKKDLEELLLALNGLEDAEAKGGFVRAALAMGDDAERRRAAVRTVVRDGCDEAPSVAEQQAALQYIIDTASGRKMEDLLWYEVRGRRNVARRRAVYRFVTGRAYALLASSVCVAHCCLAFWEAPTSRAYAPRGAMRDVLLAEGLCLLGYAADLALLFFTFGCFHYKIVRGSWRRAGVRLNVVCMAALALAMAADWAVHLATGYETGTATLPMNLARTAAVRPFYLLLRSARIRNAASSFLGTLVHAQDVFALYGLFLTVASVMGVILFSSSPFYDADANPFDGVLTAWRQMFVFMTTAENYPDLALAPADRNGGGTWLYAFYFVFFAAFGTLVALSLIIAIYELKYGELHEREQRRLRLNQHKGMVAAFALLDKDNSGILEAEEFRSFCSLRMNADFPDDATLNPTEFVELCEQLLHRLALSQVFRLNLNLGRRGGSDRLQRWLLSPAHSRVMLLLGTADLWLLTLYGTFEDTATLDALTTLVLVLFAAEVALRIGAFSWDRYWNSASDVYVRLANRYDLLVTAASLAGLAAIGGSPGASMHNGSEHLVLALPALRLFSDVRLIKTLFFGLIAIIPGFAATGALVAITVYVFAVVGCNLFAGEFDYFDDDVYDMPVATFNSFTDALQTLSQLVIGEAWSSVMEAAVAARGGGMAFYFLAWILIVVVLFTTLFAAIIISAFHAVESLRREKGTSRVTVHELDLVLEGKRSYRYFHISLPADPSDTIVMKKLT